MRRVDGNPRLREEKLAAFAQKIIDEAPYDIKELFSRKMELWSNAGFYPFLYHAGPVELTGTIGWRLIANYRFGTHGSMLWMEWGGGNTAYRIYISFSYGVPERVEEDISFVVSAKRV